MSPSATNGQPWDHDDRLRLPRWFEARRHLPKKQIELEFERDFDHRRKYSGIYAVWYQQNGNKRKRALRYKGKPSKSQAASHCQPTLASDCTQSSFCFTSSDGCPSAARYVSDAFQERHRRIHNSTKGVSIKTI